MASIPIPRRTRLLAPLVLLGCLDPAAAADRDAERILEAALERSRTHEKLTYLSDRIGHRLSGSEALERAVAWTAERFRKDGLERVWTEEVLVPHWVRGHEAARIEEPVVREMALLGLGGSVGTPLGGISAEVLVVDDLEHLATLSEEIVRGKIVLFDKAMAPGFGADPGYGTVVQPRAKGPSAAARLGAVGMLIRSVGTADFRLPHTGALSYEEGAPKIPAAALSAEDALRIRRFADAGERVRVRLELGARQLPDARSANVLAELRGRELPDEIVLIGAHLDTWDVGDGAHDDGAGCAIVMETLRLLLELELTPRRTIRAVLFTNEENGLRGGKDYARRHGDEHHVVAIESDAGGDIPLGVGVTAGEGALEMVERIVRPLEAIDAAQVRPRGGGADISPLRKLGVPVMSLTQEIEHYFDYHHTAADTLDKVDPDALNRNLAVMALVAWRLAEQEETLPRLAPSD